MSEQLSPAPIFQSFLPNGAFNVGGKVFTFIAGTSTPQATFTDASGAVQNTNPIILNSLGQASIWLNPALTYKYVVQDSFGNPLYTTDNISGALSTSGPIVIGPPASGVALTVNNVSGADAIDINYTQQPGLGFAMQVFSSALTGDVRGFQVFNSAVGGTGGCFGFGVGNDTNSTFFMGKNNTGAVGRFIGAPNGDLAWLFSGGTTPIAICTGTFGTGITAQILVTAGSPGAVKIAGALNVIGAASTGPITITGTANISGAISIAGAAGINGATPVAPVNGWGTPTGPAVVNNYSGTAATLVQTSNAVAQIIATLKAFGLFGV